nr:hypothetical protein CFP56_48747 [Quercus suber]
MATRGNASVHMVIDLYDTSDSEAIRHPWSRRNSNPSTTNNFPSRFVAPARVRFLRMAYALSTTVSLTPSLAAQAWTAQTQGLDLDPRRPATKRLNAVNEHYQRVLEINSWRATARLMQAVRDLEASTQIQRQRVWKPFIALVGVWRTRLEELDGQHVSAGVLVRELWARANGTSFTHALRQAPQGEKEIMMDLLWTILHRAAGLEW